MFLILRKNELFLAGLLILAAAVFQSALWIGGQRQSAAASAQVTVRPEQVVVIDAGHGGEDGGAVASDGVTTEAGINLAIARRLETILAFMGFQPVMTREEDVSLHTGTPSSVRERKMSDLQARVDTVNQAGGIALISIHQNSLPSVPSVHGAQVFYRDTEESQALALAMQELLNSEINTERAKAAKVIDDSIYLLRNVTCPAVLVECGFLSNPEETVTLTDGQYQQKLALLIASGFLQWQEGGEGGT